MQWENAKEKSKIRNKVVMKNRSCNLKMSILSVAKHMIIKGFILIYLQKSAFPR